MVDFLIQASSEMQMSSVRPHSPFPSFLLLLPSWSLYIHIHFILGSLKESSLGIGEPAIVRSQLLLLGLRNIDTVVVHMQRVSNSVFVHGWGRGLMQDCHLIKINLLLLGEEQNNERPFLTQEQEEPIVVLRYKMRIPSSEDKLGGQCSI